MIRISAVSLDAAAWEFQMTREPQNPEAVAAKAGTARLWLLVAGWQW